MVARIGVAPAENEPSKVTKVVRRLAGKAAALDQPPRREPIHLRRCITKWRERQRSGRARRHMPQSDARAFGHLRHGAREGSADLASRPVGHGAVCGTVCVIVRNIANTTFFCSTTFVCKRTFSTTRERPSTAQRRHENGCDGTAQLGPGAPQRSTQRQTSVLFVSAFTGATGLRAQHASVACARAATAVNGGCPPAASGTRRPA